MDLSKEEKEKFMSMVADDNYKAKDIGKYFINNLSKVSYVEIFVNKFSIDGEYKDVRCLMYAYKTGNGLYKNDNGLHYMQLNCDYDSDSFDFIVSIINKVSPNMRIIYSSDTQVVYSSEHIDVKDIEFSVDIYSKRTSWISLSRRTSYPLHLPKAVVCDEILKQLCSDDNKKHALLTEYASHTESMSKEIRDKIKPIYDALPCGEKLLIELGCDVQKKGNV